MELNKNIKSDLELIKPKTMTFTVQCENMFLSVRLYADCRMKTTWQVKNTNMQIQLLRPRYIY